MTSAKYRLKYFNYILGRITHTKYVRVGKDLIDLYKYSISQESSILEALKKIDANKRGFVVVVDIDQTLLGILTDGDLRRQLIRGSALTDQIEYQDRFEQLLISDNFQIICNKFKSEKIEFLPIVDESGKLKNILTKKVFHTLLLHNMNWNLSKDFDSIDQNEIDFEIYDRPWGFYKSTLISDFVQSKIITVFPHSQLSLQEHKRREEHWVIVKGTGVVILGESQIDIYPGKYIYIPKGCKHQIINNTDENIIFSEVQLGDYFGEDDIIRYYDIYSRK